MREHKRKVPVVMALLAVFLLLAGSFLFKQETRGANITWDGGGGDNNWSTDENWVGDSAPGSGDVAIFDGTSTKDATIDSGANLVAGVQINSGYTGTITQGTSYSFGSSGFTQADGTFTASGDDQNINGTFSLSGGTFNAGSGTLRLDGDLTVTGGTFNGQTGTLRLDSTDDQSIDVDTTLTVNSLYIDGGHVSQTDFDIASGDTIVVTGTTTFGNGGVDGPGTIEVQGPFVMSGTDFDDGTVNVNFTGTSVRNITITDSVFPGLELDAANTTITFSPSGNQMVFRNDVSVADGTIDLSSEEEVFISSGPDGDEGWTISGGTFIAPAGELQVFGVSGTAPFAHTGGTFTHSSGTVAASGDVAVSGSTTFHNFTFTGGGSDTLTFEAGETQTFSNSAAIGNESPGIRAPFTYTSVESDSSGVAANLSGTFSIYAANMTDIANTSGSNVVCSAKCNDVSGNSGFDWDGKKVRIGDVSGDVDEDGGTATFDVSLLARPNATVTVNLAAADSSELGLSASSLSFTTANWETAQTVTVTGQDDVLSDGDVTSAVTITVSSSDTDYDALDPDDPSVTNLDNETSTTSFYFGDEDNYDAEDLSNVTGTDVDTYIHFIAADGSGVFSNSGSMSFVDLRGTKVQRGCTVEMSGEEYIIADLYDTADTMFFNVVLSRPGVSLADLDTELDASGGTHTVDAIRCTDPGSGSMGLESADNIVDTEFFGYHDGTYDAANEKVWTTSRDDDTFMTVIDVPGETSSDIDISGFHFDAAVDTSAGVVWVTDEATDEVVAFDAATNGFEFGTEGASSFSVGNAPRYIEYDSTNDAIWVVGDDLQQIDPSDGSVDTTISSLNGTDIAYDSTQDRIWVVTDDDTLIEIDGSTATYANGTQANSTYVLPPLYTGSDNRIFYEPTNNLLWIHSGEELIQIDPSDFTITQIVGADASEDGGGEGGGGYIANSIGFMSSVDEFVIPSYEGDVFHRYSIIDGVYVNLVEATGLVNAGDFSYSAVTIDGNEVWLNGCTTQDCYENFAYGARLVKDAVPTDQYYTITSNSNSQIDVTSVTSIDSVAVTETKNSQDIFYAVKFDNVDSGNSWIVDGSQRKIASDRNSVTGNGDGTWSYRDNADTWTAATINSEQTALSQAIAAGSNNQMTGTEMAALADSDWTTLGFESGTTTSLDLAATFHSDDPEQAPTVESAAFTFSGGGSPPTTTTTTETSSTTTGETMEVLSCAPEPDITVTLSGDKIEDYLLSEDPEFTEGDWMAFEDVGTEDQPTMFVPFTLSDGDGTKTLYAKFRSSSDDQSEVISAELQLDEANECIDPTEPEEGTEEEGEEEEEGGTPTVEGDLHFIGCIGNERVIPQEERETFMFGVATPGEMTPEGIPSTIELVRPGDYVRSVSWDTVYCIDEHLDRRPFVVETDYFTHTRSFEQTRWVTDFALGQIPLAGPMLPKEGTSLLKFMQTDEVYVHEQSPEDSTRGLLYWITTEELASFLFGSSWAGFVVDVATPLYTRFDFGEPIVRPIEVDTEELRHRDFLNERSAEIAGSQLNMQTVMQKLKDLVSSNDK